MKALAGQYQSARNQVEREEKRMLVQAGINIQDRVFTSEEVYSGGRGKGGRTTVYVPMPPLSRTSAGREAGDREKKVSVGSL